MKRLGEVMSSSNPLLPTKAPCADCGIEVELEPFAAELAVMLSKALLSRGEAPLADNEIVRCQDCGPRWEADQRRIAHEQLYEARRLFGVMRSMRGSSVDAADRWLTRLPRWFRDEYTHAIAHWKANFHVVPEKGRSRRSLDL